MNWTGKDVINNNFLTFAITVGVLASTEAYSWKSHKNLNHNFVESNIFNIKVREISTIQRLNVHSKVLLDHYYEVVKQMPLSSPHLLSDHSSLFPHSLHSNHHPLSNQPHK